MPRLKRTAWLVTYEPYDGAGFTRVELVAGNGMGAQGAASIVENGNTYFGDRRTVLMVSRFPLPAAKSDIARYGRVG